MKRTLLIAGTLALLMGAPLQAQTNNGSDVTGPGVAGSTTAGGLYSPSPTTTGAAASPTVMAAVTAAGANLSAQMTSGSLTTVSGAAIPAQAQAAVLGVMNGSTPPAQLASVLGAGGAGTQATALATTLQGLLSNPSPGQLMNAVTQYNAMIMGSSAEFLSSPPAELQVVQTVLNQLVGATNTAG